MAGVTPNEAEHLFAHILFNRTYHVDRDADLKLGLFANTSGLSETSALADITAITGTGSTAKTLTDASWTVTNDTASYAKQTFTAGAGGFSAAVYGYYIYTIASGGTARLLHYEIDASGPRTMAEGAVYEITPNITVA